MADAVNLKAVMTADTSQFVKGTRQVKDDLKNLDKLGGDTFSKLGDMIGVDFGKLNDMASAARGLGEKFTKSGNESIAALGNMIKSLDLVSMSIAGLGIGAVVGSFKLLNAEAENFKNTIAGANIEMATAAYIDTYKQAIHDMYKDIGKSAAESQSSWKKFWSTFGTNVKYSFMSGAMTDSQDVVDKALARQEDATARAEKAEQLANELWALQRRQKEETVKIAELDAEIAKEREKAVDPENTITERLQAQKNAAALIAEKYNILTASQNEMVRITSEMNGLTENSVAAEDALIDAKAKAKDIERQKADETRTIDRLQKSLTTEANKEAAAIQAAKKAREEMAALRQGVQSLDLTISEDTKTNIQNAIDAQVSKDLTVEAKLLVKPDEKAIESAVMDLTPILENSFEDIGSSIGSLLGDLISGGDAWKNFASNAVTAFGNMAVAVGKMAIATGTATLGIKAALESLNGYVAIAAGVALVALGTAVKQGLGNIASGNYSASSNVASSSSYSGNSLGDYYQREIDVNLSGSFTVSGNNLVAVLDNENKRRNHTC